MHATRKFLSGLLIASPSWIFKILDAFQRVDFVKSFAPGLITFLTSPAVIIVTGFFGFGLMIAGFREMRLIRRSQKQAPNKPLIKPSEDKTNITQLLQSDSKTKMEGPNRINLLFETTPLVLPHEGIILSVLNESQNNIARCRVIVKTANSVESKTGHLRAELQFHPPALIQDIGMAAGHPSGGNWLVQVRNGELELGPNVGQARLMWPPLDASNEQFWLIKLQVICSPHPDWYLSFFVRWIRSSGELQVRE